MIEHRVATLPEFSLFQTTNKIFYHQMGDYVLQDENGFLVPANRSYVADLQGDRKRDITYTKDVAIHERMSATDVKSTFEVLVDVYGKPLLFVKGDGAIWHNSQDTSDKIISAQAKDLLCKIEDYMGKSLLGISYKMGLFGSRRVGLHGVDSDIDLVLWTDFTNRRVLIDMITSCLKEIGYKTSAETNRDLEYAQRYARRFGISELAGFYLARKRVRFLSSAGVFVSLQCLDIGNNHESIGSFMEGLNNKWESREVSLECKVVSAKAAYNFPKVWKLDINGKEVTAVSFSWMHQGMGDDNGVFGQNYQISAALVSTEGGEFLYFRDSSHFLLPKVLL